MRARTVVALVLVLVMVAGAFAALVKAPNVSANQGSKDSYGYFWTDSKTPGKTVPYNWIEINGTGTPWNPNSGDVVAGPYALGFSFKFYGNAYTQVYIGSNGLIGFGSSTGLTDWYNDYIPYSSTPNNYIAAYWDELYVYNPYSVYYGSVGSAPDRQFVVEYAGATEWSSGQMYFEIILNETGDIWMQYRSLSGRTGSSATVGIENSAGSAGCQYSYNSGTLTNGLAIRFSRGSVSTTPAAQTHTVAPGTTTTYVVNVTNLQNVSDSFKISATSSLGWSITVCDSTTLLLLTDTDSDGFPDTGTLAPLGWKNIQINVSVPANPASSPDVTTLNASSHATPLRYSTSSVTTNAFGAWLTPPHSDMAYDDDQDGEADHLLVNVSLYVRATGYYYVYGYLYTASEGYIEFQSNGTSYTSTGTKTMQLWYTPWTIRNLGVNGPYHIHLTLYDNSANLLSSNIHNTSAYLATDFMDEPGMLTAFSEYAVDTDANGKYDYLQLNITVDVAHAGQFRLYNYLDDSYGYLVGSNTNTTYLAAGLQVMTVRYDANAIWLNSVYDGVYQSDSDLYAFVDGLMYWMNGQTMDTRSYQVSDFDPPAAHFNTAGYSDCDVDLNADGDHEWLLVNVSVSVAVEGDYTITGDLNDDGWSSMTMSNTTHLTVGNHTVQLKYPGWLVYDTYDYPNGVALELTDSMSSVLDTYDYTLSKTYYYYNFVYYGATIYDHDDYGLDTDADGVYEWFVVMMNISSEVQGVFTVEGELYGPGWNFIDTVENTSLLHIGYNNVTLMYPGWMIYEDGYSGYLHIDYGYLYDEYGNELDYDWWSTDHYYYYDDFDIPPAALSTGHTSYAWCDDADGLYEWFTVNVSVDVTEPGKLFLYGELDETGTYSTVSMEGTYATTTSTGIQQLQLSFPGWLLSHSRWNGTLRVYLMLGEDRDTMIDSVYYYPGTTYYWDDFDPTVPSINSGWSTTTPTINGEFGASEWAGATMVSISSASPVNEVVGAIYVKNDATRLYVCIDAFGDTTMDGSDRASISFDTDDNDAVTTDHDDQFTVTGGFSYHYIGSGTTWALDCQPISTSGLNHSGLAADAGFGTSSGHAVNHRVYEFSIPLNLLNVTMGDTLGFLMGSRFYNGLYDSSNSTYSLWPAIGDFSIRSLGQLVLASSSVIPAAPVTTAHVTGTAGASDWLKSAAAVTFTREGGAGGVDYTEYRLDGGSWTNYTATITVSEEGTHTLEFRSMDNMSQCESTKTTTIKVDTSIPVTTPGKSGSSVWLNSSDSISGLLGTKYRIDSGTWMDYTGKITVTGVGNHTIEFYSTDNAGNTEATKSIVVKVGSESKAGGILSGFMLLALLAVVAIAAAMLLLFFVLKRRKGPQQPMMMAPPGYYQPPQGPLQGPPMQPPSQ